MRKMTFVTNCVNSTAAAISPMVDGARDITRKTFLAHVDTVSRQEIETALGYALNARQGLTMAGDYHVSYHRSIFRGRPCYFFRWSAIEYVFI
jgi:hypothetical protein